MALSVGVLCAVFAFLIILFFVVVIFVDCANIFCDSYAQKRNAAHTTKTLFKEIVHVSNIAKWVVSRCCCCCTVMALLLLYWLLCHWLMAITAAITAATTTIAEAITTTTTTELPVWCVSFTISIEKSTRSSRQTIFQLHFHVVHFAMLLLPAFYGVQTNFRLRAQAGELLFVRGTNCGIMPFCCNSPLLLAKYWMAVWI